MLTREGHQVTQNQIPSAMVVLQWSETQLWCSNFTWSINFNDLLVENSEDIRYERSQVCSTLHLNLGKRRRAVENFVIHVYFMYMCVCVCVYICTYCYRCKSKNLTWIFHNILQKPEWTFWSTQHMSH